MKKNILFVITGLGMGGAEVQVCSLADCLASRGHNILVLVLTGGAVALPNNLNVQIKLLEMEKNALGLMRGYFLARKIIQEFSPDVIHSHMVHANIFARLLRLSLKIPKLISTAHSKNEGGWLRIFCYRITDSLADISTNVSIEAVEAFVKNMAVPKGRMICVGNGTDLNKFTYNENSRNKIRLELCVNNEDKLLLAVGRLTEAKDYPNLLQSLTKVIVVNPNVILAIVGIGELKGDIEREVSRLGLKEHVKFLGLRRDVSEIMSAADVFVLSSAWEGSPLVVVEALACGRMVVATDCGGLKEVFGSSEYLVPTQDPAKLAEAINSAVGLDFEKQSIIIKSLREMVIKNYSLELVVDRWLELYQGCKL
ncbi:MAG: glycosyltransferase [Burkholderiales bacterium]|nr:glycosyltransferase [Burkholderiales bacterium]